jgi:hypothetical protein
VGKRPIARVGAAVEEKGGQTRGCSQCRRKPRVEVEYLSLDPFLCASNLSLRYSGFYLYSLPVMNLTSKQRVRALLDLGELHFDLRYSST